MSGDLVAIRAIAQPWIHCGIEPFMGRVVARHWLISFTATGSYIPRKLAARIGRFGTYQDCSGLPSFRQLARPQQRQPEARSCWGKVGEVVSHQCISLPVDCRVQNHLVTRIRKLRAPTEPHLDRLY